MGSQFQYQPITEPDGIRLFILHSAEGGSNEIRCSIVSTTLSQCEHEIIDHYTALSYVWGDASDLKMVWVDGAERKVTSNLHKALLHIRDKSRPLRMWVDAICINQEDDNEKSIQVAMMGRVYAAAAHTIIFLGTPEDDLGEDPKPVDLELAEIIVHKSWFKRVWVFQELIFSKDPWVQYGGHRWRWDVIHDRVQEQGSEEKKLPYVRLLPKYAITVSNIIQQSNIVHEMHMARKRHQNQETQGNGIMDLIFVRRGLGVTDPRDMIFAHLGFALDTIRPKVDYTKMLEQVYTDLAVLYIQVTKDCRIMFHVNGDDECITNPSENISPGMNPSPRPLPSWVPDWRMPTPTNIEPHTIPIQNSLVPLSKRLKRNTSVQVCISGMLTVSILGCRSEQVVKLSDPLSYKKI